MRTGTAWPFWALVLGLTLATPGPAAAQKRFSKHPKRAGEAARRGGGRSIRQESRLAPKVERGLTSDLTQVKDLRPANQAKGPGLSTADLSPRSVEQLLDDKLDEEIKLASDLLQYETNCEEVAPVRYRLGDLFWEKSKRYFFKSNDFATPEGARADFAQRMKSMQNNTLVHYQAIVDECPTYSDFAKVLFYYGRALMEMDRAAEGAALFKQVIEKFPGSEWVAQAWFMVGEYYFNSANDANQALKAYLKASETPNTPIYGFALYKQGWCYINVAEWPLALQRFREVVAVSEDKTQPIDDRARISLRKEALKDFVRAYANLGDPREAMRVFRELARPQEWAGMMEALGNWYINQGAHANVVVVYHSLIKANPRSIRLPIWQGRVVDAISRAGVPRDTVRETKVLSTYFLDLRKRVAAHALDQAEMASIDKDMREAEDIAENTVRRLATEYHKDAKKLRGQGQAKQYALALELYRHYLEVFPEPKPNAEVNYVFYMRFYYAEVLYKLEKFREAADNYDQVVAINPHPKEGKEKEIVLAAAEESVRSLDELVTDLDRARPPEISGTKPKDIPPIKQRLIDSCRRYIDLVGLEGDKIVEIRYKMARIYYTYNHFDQAAPAFNDIVQNHPENPVACYAANLALDIYNGNKDFRALKESAHAYLSSKRLACGDEDRKRFQTIEEKSAFFLIKSEFEDNKKFLAAGNAYMSFYRDHPNSEFADDAVYNAAVNYDMGNRLDKANEVRRFLVEKLPNSPLVPETLYNIAQSYERIVDFANAAKYLDMFAKRYPKDPRSKDAVYNAGLYLATLHEFAAARLERQTYVKNYASANEAHLVAFANCEATDEEARLAEAAARADKKHGADLEKVALRAWQDAHDCYFAYIRNGAFAAADVDLACHAHFRRGEIMRTKTHYDKGAEEQRRLLLRMWPTWKKKEGAGKLPRCATAVADLMYQDMAAPQKKYQALAITELNPTDRGKKAFDASLAAKVRERDQLVAGYRAVAELGVPKWALAALFSIGEAYRESIDRLLTAPIPDKIPGYKLTAEDKGLLRQKLREMAKPIEETAVEAYGLCVSKANELGVYNKWSVRALDQLQRLRPEAYPLVVETLLPVALAPELSVARNDFVILDGDGLKPVQLKWKENGTPSAGPPPAEAPAPAPGPAPAAEAPPAADPDGVPTPVEETSP